jgi:hypothetical protein
VTPTSFSIRAERLHPSGPSLPHTAHCVTFLVVVTFRSFPTSINTLRQLPTRYCCCTVVDLEYLSHPLNRSCLTNSQQSGSHKGTLKPSACLPGFVLFANLFREPSLRQTHDSSPPLLLLSIVADQPVVTRAAQVIVQCSHNTTILQ